MAPAGVWRGFRNRLVMGLSSALVLSLAGAEFDWGIPKRFPVPSVPADNPMTVGKVTLGRYLFYDRRMSVNGKTSCGDCHRQELAFTDGRARAIGATGQVHPRGSMSLVNIAYAPRLTWANPALESLEEQALAPMFGEHPVEMGLQGRESIFLTAVRNDSRYRRLFAEAFPEARGDVYSIGNVTKALAAFERSIVSMRSPYDRYRWGGDAGAISDSAKRGEIVFSSSEKGGCFQCHGGWNFSAVRFAGGTDRMDGRDGMFFTTGVSGYRAPNRGLAEHTGRAEDIGKFKAPTLRNVAVTGPYMHDGSAATLADVLSHYEAGGKVHHPNRSRAIHPLVLSEQEKADLLAFLEALTDKELLTDKRWSDPWR